MPPSPLARVPKLIITTTHLCISDADLLIPLHNKINNPTIAIDTKKRVLVTSTKTALHGGSLALADFHVTPPLGRSMIPIIPRIEFC